jgi:aldehyde dehydrogenase (NAD+)
MAAPARGNLLYKAADIMDRKFDQLGAEMTREEGKTLPEAKGEVRRAINILRYFGGEGSRMQACWFRASETGSTCSRSASRWAWWG